MKSLVAVVLSLFAVSALATQIPQDKLATYQKAVRLSLEQTPLTCAYPAGIDHWAAGSLAAAIDATTDGDINNQGAQPLLKFTEKSGSDNTQFDFTVTTSADYKTVVSVKFEQKEFSSHDVNLGTIENPNIVSQTTWTVTQTVVCQ